MECDRNNCGNIMCHKYHNDVGYICPECIEEFKAHVNQLENKLTRKTKIRQALIEFMGTKKGEKALDTIMSVNEFFEEM